jgi:hypothetical protein
MATNSFGSQKPPTVPAFTHPALNDWGITRELAKLEESYRRDQRHNPSARRLRQHSEAIEAVFDREIGRGRFPDTPHLWAAVYSHILVSVCAKINSLLGNGHRRLWRIGGGGPSEQATFEETHRECNRVRASVDGKLAQACAQCEPSSVEVEVLSHQAPKPGDSEHDKTNRRPSFTALDKSSSVRETGIARAILVEEIRREMGILSQALELSEDYDTRIRSNGSFANFKTVSVCNCHQDLRDKLCVIKTTKKPKIVEIACDIASRCGDHNIRPKTFEDAHRRYGAVARERLKNRR